MINDIVFIGCHNLRFDPKWSLGFHCHESFEMILVVEGVLQLECDDTTSLIYPGSLITIPAYKLHCSSVYGDNRLHFMSMKWYGGATLARLHQPMICADRNNRIQRQMQWILDYFPGQPYKHTAMLNALNYTILYEIGELHKDPASDLLAQVRAYSRTHLRQRITLEDLANASFMSKYHFARTFKQTTGQTPMQVVNRTRMEVARHLIMQTKLPLEDIAIQVGLVDASHLTRLFRKYHDCTPGSLRGHLREAAANMHHQD